jgi:hypothetical protein
VGTESQGRRRSCVSSACLWIRGYFRTT